MICLTCLGTGWIDVVSDGAMADLPQVCPECDGYGVVEETGGC